MSATPMHTELRYHGQPATLTTRAVKMDRLVILWTQPPDASRPRFLFVNPRDVQVVAVPGEAVEVPA